jgi:uncharacterized membrane protein YbhN (UPF0104 family)
MSRAVWTWARLAGGAAILAVLVWRLGTGPILDGLRTISVGTLVSAGAITVVTTVCSAWRWVLVARGLGVSLPLGAAIAAYYRSQFLNTTLPGGVLGDVHRAVRHGRDVADPARRPAVTGAVVHAGRRRGRCRRGARRRAGPSGSAASRVVAVGAGPARRGRGHPGRVAR